MGWRRIGGKSYLNQCWPDSLTHICSTKGGLINLCSTHRYYHTCPTTTQISHSWAPSSFRLHIPTAPQAPHHNWRPPIHSWHFGTCCVFGFAATLMLCWLNVRRLRPALLHTEHTGGNVIWNHTYMSNQALNIAAYICVVRIWIQMRYNYSLL